MRALLRAAFTPTTSFSTVLRTDGKSSNNAVGASLHGTFCPCGSCSQFRHGAACKCVSCARMSHSVRCECQLIIYYWMGSWFESISLCFEWKALCACSSCVESHPTSCKCSSCSNVHSAGCRCDSCNSIHTSYCKCPSCTGSHSANCDCVVCSELWLRSFWFRDWTTILFSWR